MMRLLTLGFGALVLGMVPAGKMWAQSPDIDAQLLKDIRGIRAVDNHTHVPKVVKPGEAPDDDYDALPVPEAVEFQIPFFMRPEENRLYLEAEKVLYGYKYDDLSPAHLKELQAMKERVMREQGERYPVWVLDKIGTDVMVANRIAMGPGLMGPRFRWVSYEDAFMYPLNNSELLARSPIDEFLFKREDALLTRYLKNLAI
ncbi:MAG: amidohydrolase, partial [Acidobacteriaceae bacterium]